MPPLAIPLQRHPNLRAGAGDDFPPSFVCRGKRYRRTGKFGTRNSDGVRSAEYEGDDASRGWLGADGRVTPD